jgi:protein-tyrosine phosphatase
MWVTVYWIGESSSGRMGIRPRPRGGDWLEDEVISLRQSKVDAVVSLLEPVEVSELELMREEEFCQKHGIAFHSFSIPDRQVPGSLPATRRFVGQLVSLLSGGKNLVIHCRQGIGRSSLIAACALVEQGYSVADAFEIIELARGCQVPDTQEQRDWLRRFIQAY